jgi:OOP family OmpA-OmpF porin
MARPTILTGYTESRPVVKNGKPTGEQKQVKADGTATWTPGDVTVATKKGGIVGVASTKEYSYQMPSLVIGITQWMDANQGLTQNILAAAFEGGEIILNSDAALEKAAGIEAKVFKQENAAYWKKYFKGVTQATGMQVSLGGSTVSGLADNAFYFGLNGNDNIFKKVYTVYGAIDHAYYPSDMPTVLPYEQAVDMKFVQALLSGAKTMAPAQTASFSANAKVKDVISKAIWKIEFESGKATFKAGSQETLDDLLNQLSAGDMTIQIKGYTDNVGNDESNLALSNKRANAVKAWLSANAPGTMTADRIKAIGYGGASPIADNATPTGRAQNRRVEILQVTTN